MSEQDSLTQDYETPYKFNGKELDTETGLYYYGARYYDPRTSIWLSTDPLIGTSYNLEDGRCGDIEGDQILMRDKNGIATEYHGRHLPALK